MPYLQETRPQPVSNMKRHRRRQRRHGAGVVLTTAASRGHLTGRFAKTRSVLRHVPRFSNGSYLRNLLLMRLLTRPRILVPSACQNPCWGSDEQHKQMQTPSKDLANPILSANSIARIITVIYNPNKTRYPYPYRTVLRITIIYRISNFLNKVRYNSAKYC